MICFGSRVAKLAKAVRVARRCYERVSASKNNDCSSPVFFIGGTRLLPPLRGRGPVVSHGRGGEEGTTKRTGDGKRRRNKERRTRGGVREGKGEERKKEEGEVSVDESLVTVSCARGCTRLPISFSTGYNARPFNVYAA